MKKTNLLFIVFALVISTVYAQRVDALVFFETNPVFSWESTTINVGKTNQNVPVTAVFRFKNTGGAPLIITKVQPACGCTTPEFSSEPVYPGGTGFIKATYSALNAGSF